MEIVAYISANGERFLVSDNYRNIDVPARGHKPLPLDGYPYSMEMVHRPLPKFILDDEPWSYIHNVMCMTIHDHVDWIGHLKDKCKDSDQHPAPFLLSAINFVTNDMAAYCNAHGLTNIFDYPLSKDRIVDIVTLMSIRKECGIGADVVTAVVEKLLKDDKLSYADALESSLPIVMNDEELRSIVSEVIAEHPDKVVEWKSGKKGIASMFIGSVMRKKKGLDPKKVATTIEESLRAL